MPSIFAKTESDVETKKLFPRDSGFILDKKCFSWTSLTSPR